MSSMSLQERREQWKVLIEEQEFSELSQEAFCNLHNLPFSTFTYYRGQFRSKQKESKNTYGEFSPVSITSASDPTEIRLSLSNGLQCSFPADIKSTRLKELVAIFLSC
ncbi:MAG: hypothetical protein M3R00_02655 [Pseudomonadota bacterium]|nr:hypothetical protein [Pseudomonadota bacterium]